MKIKKNILIIMTLLLFFSVMLGIASCGLPSFYFFESPRSIRSYLDGTVQWVFFQGINEEYETIGSERTYLFVGYDVYYSFGGTSTYKIANIHGANDEPGPSLNLTERFSHRIDFDDLRDTGSANYDILEATRFVYNAGDWWNTTSLDAVYTNVSIPISVNMIQSVLSLKQPDNVRFCFGNVNPPKDNSIDTNPCLDTNVIKFEKLYPNYVEFGAKDFYNDALFAGFYDEDFYEYMIEVYDIPEVEGKPGTYLMSLYVVAKGFNGTDNCKPSGFVDSVLSDLVTIEFTP